MNSGDVALDKRILLRRRKFLVQKLAETDDRLQAIAEQEYLANVAEGHYQESLVFWEATAKAEQKDEPPQI